jgi:hypothetical protein
MIDVEELVRDAAMGAIVAPVLMWASSKLSGDPPKPWVVYRDYAVIGAVSMPIALFMVPRLRRKMRRIK